MTETKKSWIVFIVEQVYTLVERMYGKCTYLYNYYFHRLTGTGLVAGFALNAPIILFFNIKVPVH